MNVLIYASVWKNDIFIRSEKLRTKKKKKRSEKWEDLIYIVLSQPFLGCSISFHSLIIVLQDQFDTIDFTDNDIRKLDKFPLLKRLKHILLSNNRIV